MTATENHHRIEWRKSSMKTLKVLLTKLAAIFQRQPLSDDKERAEFYRKIYNVLK